MLFIVFCVMYYRLVYQLLSLDKLLDTDCVNLTTCLSALGDHLKANCKQQGRPGGVQWYTSIPEKNSPKYPKIPKIHPNIPKIIPRYTLYLKFKESDIPNTCI